MHSYESSIGQYFVRVIAGKYPPVLNRLRRVTTSLRRNIEHLQYPRRCYYLWASIIEFYHVAVAYWTVAHYLGVTNAILSL